MRFLLRSGFLPVGRSLMAVAVASSLVMAITGCNGWIRAPEPATTPPVYRQYQVWTRDSRMFLHHVRVEHDSLYGIPVEQSRDCLTCFLVIPMTSVDSMQTGTTQHVGTAVIGVAAGGVAAILFIAALIALSGYGGSD